MTGWQWVATLAGVWLASAVAVAWMIAHAELEDEPSFPIVDEAEAIVRRAFEESTS